VDVNVKLVKNVNVTVVIKLKDLIFTEDTTRTTKKGGKGTLKRKLSKAGVKGKATISKMKKFKKRKNATAHDKAQANFVINMLRARKKK
jgi:hypothetical protein